jgi:hypothetical protein
MKEREKRERRKQRKCSGNRKGRRMKYNGYGREKG